MNADQFRTSEHQKTLALFLGTNAGRDLILLLKEYSLPSPMSTEQHGTREDVQFQMAMETKRCLAKKEIIDKIIQLSTAPKNPKPPEIEPLEPEDAAAVDAHMQRFHDQQEAMRKQAEKPAAEKEQPST